MIVGSVLIVLSVYYLPIWLSGSTFLILSSVVVGGFIYVWQSYSILLSPLSTLILYIISFTSAAFNNFYKEFVLRQQIKKQFETYLDPRQVYLLQKNPGVLKLGGEMTFLFMDICGFTPVSEHYKNNNDPEGLVLLINDFLDNMTKIILANGGTIDKYMGDCIMAFWNAPLDCPNHADMAVKTAIEIEAKTDELRKKYTEQGLPPINVGTGINTGDCIVGNMGSESRFDYSVIGDAVNLAARLEATAARGEYINCPTILSSYTADKLTTINPRPIGDIKVKGKEELIKIYAP
jgi:adenylate cyclase